MIRSIYNHLTFSALGVGLWNRRLWAHTERPHRLCAGHLFWSDRQTTSIVLCRHDHQAVGFPKLWVHQNHAWYADKSLSCLSLMTICNYCNCLMFFNCFCCTFKFISVSFDIAETPFDLHFFYWMMLTKSPCAPAHRQKKFDFQLSWKRYGISGLFVLASRVPIRVRLWIRHGRNWMLCWCPYQSAFFHWICKVKKKCGNFLNFFDT